jgi:hypothetical protein
VKVMSLAIVLSASLRGEMKVPFGKLYAAWIESRPGMWGEGLLRALLENTPSMVGVARKVLAAKDEPLKFKAFDRRALALRFLGLHGNAADIPLVMKFADVATEFDRLEFSKYPGGELAGQVGASRPSVKNTDVVVQVRDVAMIAVLQLHKQKPQDFGFGVDVVHDAGPGFSPAMLTPLGFCRDTDREAAHKKAREWLDKQKEKVEPKKDEPDAAKLVEQLGAEDFAAREAAEKKLKELGARAKPAVQAGLRSESPEIARRCRAVLYHLRAEEVKAAFLKLGGDDDLAHSLLAEVLKDAHRARVLTEAVEHPERSGKLYAAEQWRLWQKAVSTPAGAKEADIPTAPEIALSFFLGSHPSSADALKTEPPPNDPRISEGRRATESGLLCKSLQLELIDPKRRGPYARLMAGWLAARSDPWLVSLGLSEARQYRLPEFVPVARQVVRNAKIGAQHRAAAALALADLGGAAELPTLRGLMDDKTEWSRSFQEGNPDGPTFTVELRDVAVGATLLLSNQDPGEFGFPAFREPGVAELKLHEKLSGRCFAFTSDADRDAAHKAARAWLDKQKPE